MNTNNINTPLSNHTKWKFQIGDFGLAIYSNETINPMQKGLLPLKWLAPECYTENSFSTKSDV